ncbi:MAG: minor capsid protein [Aerococcus suis]|nr:minor capsid protein [Aerococcus suis]
MGVKVNFNPIYSQLKRSNDKATTALAKQAGYDMNNYVPMESGDLRGSMRSNKNGISWDTRYARAQFYGTNGRAVFRKYTVAGTGKRWDLKAESIHGNQWEDLVKRCY